MGAKMKDWIKKTKCKVTNKELPANRTIKTIDGHNIDISIYNDTCMYLSKGLITLKEAKDTMDLFDKYKTKVREHLEILKAIIDIRVRELLTSDMSEVDISNTYYDNMLVVLQEVISMEEQISIKEFN